MWQKSGDDGWVMFVFSCSGPAPAPPHSGVPPSPCFPIFLARTTFVLESLPEAKNPGQDAFLGDFVFNSSYSRDNSLLD